MPGENEKVAELEGQVTTLEAKVQSLTKKLEVARAANENAGLAADLQGQLDDLAKTVEELKTASATAKSELDKANAEKAEAEAIAKTMSEMDEDEREHYKSLSKEDQAKFRGLSSGDRKKAVKKAADDDETITIDGKAIRKSAVGDGVFEIMKAQAKQIEKTQAEVAKERNAREQAEFTKRAEALAHVPGSVEERTAMVAAVSKMSPELRKSFEAVLEQSDKLGKAGFDKLGHGGGKGAEDDTLAKASRDFMAKVAEIRSRDKCTESLAMSKARKEFPKLFEAYQETEKHVVQ